VSNRHDAPPVTTTSAEQAYLDVLADVGVRVPGLDAVDERLLSDLENGTGQIIDDPSDVGGWPDLAHGTAPSDGDHDGIPDLWETAHGLDPDHDDSSQTAPSCYTWLEEYLNSLASPGIAPDEEAPIVAPVFPSGVVSCE
jgi:hypothetical protein